MQPRPREPRLEDFALTPGRVRYLSGPTRSFLRDHSGPVLGCHVVILFLILLSLTRSAILSGILTFLLFLPAMLPIALLVFALDAVIVRGSRDYPKYRAFRAAAEAHTVALATWLRTQQEWWRALDGRSFELHVGQVFSQRGYIVRQVGGAGDGGVDLILTRNDDTVLVQCKAHRKPIGPGAVRELYGTLLHHKYAEAWLVSTYGFTAAADQFASGKPIRLMTLDNLIGRL